MLHHLAGRVAGEVVDDVHLARPLVVGEAFGAEREQLVDRELATGTHHHECADVLAEHLVRYSDDRGLLDVGVLEQHRLDIGRVDVVAAADDQVLLAADEVQEPVLVEVAEVTAAQPAVRGPGARGRGFVLVVLALLVRASG